ncbi:MAG: cytochrome c3 family protein [Bryobacterales bacterium]|nr:cytochrome c3 family protein [Bryobacterales bacterium]
MNHRLISLLLGIGIMMSLLLIAGRFSGARLPANQQGYEPVQPIAYSHRLHAGELQIDCQYCHVAASSSRHAGIPSGSICMNCHKQVKATFGVVRQEDEAATAEKRPRRDVVSPELRKLFVDLGLDPSKDLKDQQVTQTVAWTRVHRLPDYVYFDHRAHVNAGVSCQTCHGPVETMERMRQYATLSMGWCVNCHRDATKNGINGKPVNASIDCSVCHY